MTKEKLFKDGQEVSFYSDDILICKGTVKDSDFYDVLVENSAIPIKYIGKVVEIRGESASAFGTALAFGSGCIDENDLVTRVMVAGRSLKEESMERYCELCKELTLVTDKDRWCKFSSGTWVCDDCILLEAKKIKKQRYVSIKEN